MSTISSNLYPPIIPDVFPAFIGNVCKIYFSFSQYNSLNDFNTQCLQVSIVDTKTNMSILNSPTGIMLTSFQQDFSMKGDYNYYAKIPADNFKEDQMYKIQLRFVDKFCKTPTELTENWLSTNKDFFSEWSKVGLIKKIYKPILRINGFDEFQNKDEKITLTNPNLDIIGRLQTKGQEYLKSYNIKLYNLGNLKTPIFESEEIYTNNFNNPNEFYYEGNYELIDGEQYTLKFTYTTNNLYTKSVYYNFIIIQQGINKINAKIYAFPDEEKGHIKIQILSDDSSNTTFIGNLVIRRTSSKSNFHRWEDVNIIPYVTESKINYTWYDRTIESGIWYKYCAQKQNSRGYRGAIIQIDQPVMCLFDDIFLTTGDKQLKIIFNPSLSEFKYNVTESQQTTIGAKYPYINRNSANYFRSFPIGGLISSLSDMTNWYDPHFQFGEFKNNKNEMGLFTTKTEIYDGSKQLYNNYNEINNITQYNDYIYEREFRQKVYDFLYKHDVKLFRSTTEGNILIKLMNIDFQPIESLGRRLYSFTANAVEVDEATIKNYDKYNIQKIGQYSEYIVYKYEKIGQISKNFLENENVLPSIIHKYQKSTNEGYINEIEGLSKIKIEITSPPYYITTTQDGQIIKDTSSNNLNTNKILGYIIKINGNDFVITSTPERVPQEDGEVKIIHTGFFEIKDDDVIIKNLSFKYPVSATLDYVVKLNEKEDLSNLIQKYYSFKTIGQLFGEFSPQDMLVQKIYNKYHIKNDYFYQDLYSITGIEIETVIPNSIIYVRDSKDSGFNRHVLENGYLRLMDSEVNIQGIYFYGIHLYDNDFVETGESYVSFQDVTQPISHGIYKFSQPALENTIYFDKAADLIAVEETEVIEKLNKDFILILRQAYKSADDNFIYYNNNWYPITPDHDIICPIEGLINYFCIIEKGVYSK